MFPKWNLNHYAREALREGFYHFYNRDLLGELTLPLDTLFYKGAFLVSLK